MFRVISVLAVLWSAMMCSLGFTMDRSALAPPAWDTAPSLDAYRRVLDPALTNGDKARTTGVDATGTTSTTSGPGEPENRDRRSTTTTTTTESAGSGAVVKLVVADVAVARNDDVVPAQGSAAGAYAPRNAVLLLIDGRGRQDARRDEGSWERCKEKLPFAIEGFIRSCREEIETRDLPAGNGSVSENRLRKDCDCERLLRSNIGELLSWARNERGMVTGVVSSSNFSISIFSKYEGSNGLPIEFDESNESDAKVDLRKSTHDSNDPRRVIDVGARAKSLPTSLAPELKAERPTSYDGAWDIFDVFSKIRMAFFRSLLESLGRNEGGTYEDEYLSRGLYPLKLTATDSIGSTIKELKSVPTDQGYMLIAVAPRGELTDAVDLLQRETSMKNTLLVVTQICPGDKKPVAFVARGPNERALLEARTIWELPFAIRRAIAGDCREEGCRARHDTATVPSVEVPAQETPARKRVIRDKDTAEKQNGTNALDNSNDKVTVSSGETATTEKEKQVRSVASSETLKAT